MNQLELKVQIRDKFGRQNNLLRKQGILPAVLYGEGIENLCLQVNEKKFEKIFREAGESSLITLAIAKGEDERSSSPSGEDERSSSPTLAIAKGEDERSSSPTLAIAKGEVEGKNFSVLIHDVYRDPVSEKFLHIDFYHPSAKKQVVVEVPLVFEGKSLAMKDLGGLLLKEIQMIEVKGLAQNLPKEIKVDITKLKTFGDRVLVEDLILLKEVSVLRDKKDIVALVVMPKKEKEEKKPEVKEEEVKEEEVEKEKGEKVESK